MLFDIESDPREEHNIAGDHPDIVADLLGDVEELKKGRPRHPRYWMMSPNWTQGFVAGKFTLVITKFHSSYQILRIKMRAAPLLKELFITLFYIRFLSGGIPVD